MKQSWFKQHIAEIIALAFIGQAFLIFRVILLKEVKAESSVEISIIECIKGILFLIIGYYFGSSVGSKKKEDIMANKDDKDDKGAI